MNRDEATEYLIDISYKFGNISVEYLTEKDGEKMREAINVLTNEQQTCEDAISRSEAIKALKDVTNLNGEPLFESLGLYPWNLLNELPSVKPQYTEDEIQKMQELEQAEIQKAYELGKAEGQKSKDAVSRQAVEKITWEEPSYTDALNVLTEVREKIRQLPSVKSNVNVDALINKIETEFSWSMYDDWGNSTDLHDGLVDIIREWAE